MYNLDLIFHESFKKALDSLALPDGTPIVRIPCKAHVIQLRLNELLRRMKAVPKNNREELEWTETESLDEAQGENKDIALTLNKVRIHHPPYFLTQLILY